MVNEGLNIIYPNLVIKFNLVSSISDKLHNTKNNGFLIGTWDTNKHRIIRIANSLSEALRYLMKMYVGMK